MKWKTLQPPPDDVGGFVSVGGFATVEALRANAEQLERLANLAAGAAGLGLVFLDAYLSELVERKDPFAAPLRSKIEKLRSYLT